MDLLDQVRGFGAGSRPNRMDQLMSRIQVSRSPILNMHKQPRNTAESGMAHLIFSGVESKLPKSGSGKQLTEVQVEDLQNFVHAWVGSSALAVGFGEAIGMVWEETALSGPPRVTPPQATMRL